MTSLKVSSQADQETDNEKQENCKYLNSVRANFTSCCEYPLVALWRWQWELTANYCASIGKANDNCCHLISDFKFLGILKTVTNDDGSTHSDVSAEGLIYSFLLSVGNDTQWSPVINNTVARCYSQFSDTNEFYCKGAIPSFLMEVIDCCYIENYLKCPKWNPSSLPECDYTYKYVQQCN